MRAQTILVVALLNGLLVSVPTEVQRVREVAVDTALVRRELAGLLGMADLGVPPGELRVESSDLALHPGVTLYTGLVPGGPHGGYAGAVVAATSDGAVLPIGSRINRRVLQALSPPTITDSTLYQYAAVVAMLDGELPVGWHLLLEPGVAPDWAIRQATQRGLNLVRARVEQLGKPARRRVSVMVMVGEDTLYLVIVDVAAKRFFDRVEKVVELATKRVG